uniref:Putative secreted protein n=1 Tax=Anopheles darlingi TaxID=43151 RepID=A0A2M4D4E3_ANODA
MRGSLLRKNTSEGRFLMLYFLAVAMSSVVTKMIPASSSSSSMFSRSSRILSHFSPSSHSPLKYTHTYSCSSIRSCRISSVTSSMVAEYFCSLSHSSTSSSFIRSPS